MGCGCGQRRTPTAVTSVNMNLPPAEAAMIAARNAIANSRGETLDLTNEQPQDNQK